MRGVEASVDAVAEQGPSSIAIGVLLAVVGLGVWFGISIWSGATAPENGFSVREAWDSGAYFYIGVPLMALAVAAAAFFRPERAWRWPLWLVAGHQLGVLVLGLGMQSGLSLVILTVILAVLLIAVFAVPAFLGSLAARARVERAY